MNKKTDLSDKWLQFYETITSCSYLGSTKKHKHPPGIDQAPVNALQCSEYDFLQLIAILDCEMNALHSETRILPHNTVS